MQIYIVQNGDTIYGISKQFGISVDEIKKLNNLNSNEITVGQVLRLPSVNQDIKYNVVAGDNLYDIAKKYNTTVASLMNANNLNTDKLYIGQQLIIPNALNNNDNNIMNSTNNYQIYTVKSGDNLYDIAQKYGMTVYELMAINNLKSDKLSLNQQLKVNNNEESVASGEECYGEGYVEPSYVLYTVKKGDSLYIIANKYGTTVENLMKLNNLNTIDLSIGQVLKVEEVTK